MTQRIDEIKIQAETQKMAPDGFFFEAKPTIQEIIETSKKFDAARTKFFALNSTPEDKTAFSAALKEVEEMVKRNGGPLYGTYNND